MKKCKVVGIGKPYESFEKKYVNLYVALSSPNVTGVVTSIEKCRASLLPDDLSVNDMVSIEYDVFRNSNNEYRKYVSSVNKLAVSE